MDLKIFKKNHHQKGEFKMGSYETSMAISALITSIGSILVLIAIPIVIFLAIKHLIKFTAKTVYEEKAKAEERHRQNTYDPEDR